MNRQQLLSRLGRRHDVLYSTGALSSWMIGRESWSQAPWHSSVRLSDNVHVDSPGRLPLRVPRIRCLDDLAMARTARRWRAALPGGSALTVLHLFHAAYSHYERWVEPDVLVYHAYDLFPQTPGWRRELADLESSLASRADLVIGSSRPIVDHLAGLGARSPVYLPNGVDFERFSRPAAEPGVMAAIPHPRIGYVGSINRKVDLALLNAIAIERPDWQVVLVGEVGNLEPGDQRNLDALLQRPNVHYLGLIHHMDLPAYMAGLDVGLLAYKIGGHIWTEGIYPLKLHEYLAVGLPVVSADLPSLREYASTVGIAEPAAHEWVSAIERAIPARNDPAAIAARRAVAARNDWNDRVDTLEREIARAAGMVERCREAPERKAVGH
jgi:glycosyltransferase involved in cell wall biosynthesis